VADEPGQAEEVARGRGATEGDGDARGRGATEGDGEDEEL